MSITFIYFELLSFSMYLKIVSQAYLISDLSMISREGLRIAEFIRLFVIGLLVNESRDCKTKEMTDDCDKFFILSVLFSSIRELIVSSDCASFSCNDNIT